MKNNDLSLFTEETRQLLDGTASVAIPRFRALFDHSDFTNLTVRLKNKIHFSFDIWNT